MKKNSKSSKSELRRQAEEKLSKHKYAAQPEQETDTLRLVHELEVHQIELEMQNEELIQARAELEAALRQYTDLYDFAPVGYFTLTHDGTIREANLAGANLLGVPPPELTRSRLGIFVSDDSLPAYNVFFEQLLTRQGRISCELAFEKKGGGVLWGRVEATCFEGGEMCRATLADITERRQMEQALQESENRYRELIEFAVDGILLGSHEGIIISANSYMLNLTGRTLGNLIGKHVSVLFNPRELKSNPLRFDLLYQEKTVINERNLIRPDGKIVPIEMHTKMMPDGTYQSIYRDITERRQMEQALQESENRFRTILQDVSTIAVQGYAIDGTTQYWNLASAKLYGYSAQEAIGRNLLDLIIPPEMRSGVWQSIQHMAETGEPIPAAELSLMRKDGSRVSVYSSHAIVSVPGHIPELFCLDIDLTERKQGEASLRESERLYRNMNENSPLGMHFYKLNNNNQLIFVGANPAADKLLGVDNSQFTGKTIEEAFPALIQTEVPTRYRDAAAKNIPWSTEQITYEDRQVVGAFEVRAFQTTPGNMVAVFSDITTRKRVEEALRESEEKFRSLVEKSTDGVILIDEQGIIIEWNTTESKITGVPRANALGAAVWDIQHQLMTPKHRMKMTPEHLKKTYFESYLGGKADYSEKPRDIEIVSLSGEHKFLQQISFIIKTEKGHRMGSVIRDITERKQADEALRVSEERFRLLANNVPDIIYSLNGEGNIVAVNSSAFERYGYTEQDAKGKPFLSFIHPEDREIVITSFLKALEEQRKFTHGLQFRIVAEDGINYWFELNSQARYDSQSQYIGEDGVLRDITKRKQVEDALRESQELFSLFMLHSPIYTFIKQVTPTESRVLQASDNYREMIGISGADMIGKTMQDLFPPESAAKFTADDWDVVTTGKTLTLDEELNGRYYTTIKFPIIQGGKTLLAGYTLDITERVKADVELQYMKEGLQVANRELHAALALQQQLAHTDALTSINNRRNLYELAEHEFEIALRYQQPLSILMFDIDHFKRVNDTFGHTAGDRILQQVTQVTCAQLRSADVIGRYGGEEFVIVLPMTNAQQAYPLAERIRLAAEAIRVPTEKGDAAVTLSIGIVEMPRGAQPGSVESLIRRADEVMYAAKQAGRNRTEIEQ